MQQNGKDKREKWDFLGDAVVETTPSIFTKWGEVKDETDSLFIVEILAPRQGKSHPPSLKKCGISSVGKNTIAPRVIAPICSTEGSHRYRLEYVLHS